MKRRFFLIIALLFLLFVTTGCDISPSITPDNTKPDSLTIYTVNDFHGAILSDNGNYGVARLGEYIMSAKKEEPNEVMVLSAGDMFQGSGLSYYSEGESVVNLMNMIEFDAMAIGNHEFDWTLDTILEYRDGNKDNGEANFPFLGANIIEKETGTLPEYVEPYTIIERSGLTIGIIGYIGYGLESGIATKIVENYEFLRPAPIIGELSTKLRTEENCDVVIALGHDGSSTTNKELANLSGDARVDAIVNGHLHSNDVKMLTSNDGRKIPVVQAGSSGEYVGKIVFSVDPDTKTLSNPGVVTVEMKSKYAENSEILEYVSQIEEELAPIFDRVIGVAGTNISVYDIRKWGPNILQKELNVDIAFANSGGIRADAFPINAGDNITVAKIYQIMPFDNTIKICKLLGSDLRKLMGSSGLNVSDSITKIDGITYVNGKELIDDEYYSVATIDYVFDKKEFPFSKGIDVINDGKLYRDLMIEVIEKITSNNEQWNPLL